jgi:hypothetical protein
MATNMTRMRTFHNFFSVIHKVAEEHEGLPLLPKTYKLLIGFRKAVTNLLKTEGKQSDTYLCHEFLSHF